MRADGAVVADRLHDRMLAQARTGPPPMNRKGPAGENGASFGKPISASHLAVSALAAQRACRAAVRRVTEIQRRAAMMAAVGLTDASLRLAGIAAEIRTEVLT